jgi:hypothetical protein
MAPSIPQMARMSQLLDEALPLDAAERHAWLDSLPAEHRDLASALRQARRADGAFRREVALKLPRLARALRASAASWPVSSIPYRASLRCRRGSAGLALPGDGVCAR